MQKKDSDEEFECPISHVTMTDPVVDPTSGRSCERAALGEWIARNGTSPFSRQPLTVEQLIPNLALREAMAKAGLKLSATAPQSASTKSVKTNDESHLVHVAVEVGDGSVRGERTPCDVVLVIDESYSMTTEATVTGASGESESHGLSLLDLVKHAARTVVNLLGEKDRVAIVGFSNNARVLCELTHVKSKGKAQVLGCVDSIKERGNTNLWDGLFQGLELARKSADKGGEARHKAVLLLTDGLPNVEPPRGHLPTLDRYLEEHGQLAALYMFGFGYSLDSDLLERIATRGHGQYSFIPDGSFVGTAFINAISNVLATAAFAAQLHVECGEGATIDPKSPCAGLTVLPGGRRAAVDVGIVRYGQPRDVALRVRGGGCADLELSVTAAQSYGGATLRPALRDAAGGAEAHALRHRAASEVYAQVNLPSASNASVQLAGGQRLVRALRDAVGAHGGDAYLAALARDLDGQLTEAFSQADWLARWGMHYLRSWAPAQLNQARVNFKDPSMQTFGGPLFEELVNSCEKIFLGLPPPTPSIKHREGDTTVNASGKTTRYAPLSSMTSYYSSGAGCFTGDSRVLLASGARRAMRDVAPGDLLQTPAGPAAVVCVVVSHPPGERIRLARVNAQLAATEYHPMRLPGGEWRFPVDIAGAREEHCPAVYDLVLERGHAVYIGGYECATFAHGMQGPVIGHEFFGTERVVESLRRLAGWERGVVHLPPNSTIRDAATNLVVGFTQGEGFDAAVYEAPTEPAQLAFAAEIALY